MIAHRISGGREVGTSAWEGNLKRDRWRCTWSTCPIIWNEEHFYASLRTLHRRIHWETLQEDLARSGNVQKLLCFFITCSYISANLLDWFCSQYACCRNFASSLNAWLALEGYPDSLWFWVQCWNCSINNYFPGQSFSAVVLYFCWENLFLFIWHHAGWQTGVQNRSCKSGLQKIQTTPKQKLCNIQIHS